MLEQLNNNALSCSQYLDINNLNNLVEDQKLVIQNEKSNNESNENLLNDRNMKIESLSIDFNEKVNELQYYISEYNKIDVLYKGALQDIEFLHEKIKKYKKR